MKVSIMIIALLIFGGSFFLLLCKTGWEITIVIYFLIASVIGVGLLSSEAISLSIFRSNSCPSQSITSSHKKQGSINHKPQSGS
jgi:hypothetical protein